jgi:hypothetical protein
VGNEMEHQVVLHRLDRIDKTLDNLSASIERLVLVEERQLQTNAAMERAFKVLESHGVRLADLERAEMINKRTNVWVERALLACAGALGALFIKYVSLGTLNM